MKKFFQNHFRFMLLFWFNLGAIVCFAVMRTFRSLSVLNYPKIFIDRPLFHVVLLLIMLVPVVACLLGTVLSDNAKTPEGAKLIATVFGLIVTVGMIVGAFANYIESISIPIRSETQSKDYYMEFDETVSKCWIEPISAVFPAEIPENAQDIEYHYIFRNTFSVELSYTLPEAEYEQEAERLRTEFNMQGSELSLSDIIEIEDSGMLRYDISVSVSDETCRVSYFVEGSSAEELE